MDYREYRERREFNKLAETREHTAPRGGNSVQNNRRKSSKSIPHQIMMATLNEYRKIACKKRELRDSLNAYNLYVPNTSRINAIGSKGTKIHDISDKLADIETLADEFAAHMQAAYKIYQVLDGLYSKIGILDSVYLCSVYSRCDKPINRSKTDRIINKMLKKGYNITTD